MSYRYPAAIVSKNGDLIASSRIFTTDSWADYLTYRLYPRQRVFFDGRSDFFWKEMSETVFIRTSTMHATSRTQAAPETAGR